MGILETMWIWNDFLLPYLTLDLNKFSTISIVIGPFTTARMLVPACCFSRLALLLGVKPCSSTTASTRRRVSSLTSGCWFRTRDTVATPHPENFLLPYLTLDLNKFSTISIVIQRMQGSYGRVDMGAIMAALVLAVIPIVVFYLSCQKYISRGMDLTKPQNMNTASPAPKPR